MQRADEARGEEPPVVVRDRRRIDPRTGAVRAPEEADGGARVEGAATGHAQAAAPGHAQSAAPVDTAAAELKAQLDERTADLQRITAEYANYRKRVDRDREAVVTFAKAQVALDLLPVLDDVERAQAHGDLTGPFKAVADKLAAALQKSGLEPYGHEGEPFNPALHEAVQHTTSPDVDGPTVTAVLRRGYMFGDRVLRPAMVAVTDHEPAPVVEVTTEEPAPVVEVTAEEIEVPLVEPEPPGAVARADNADNAGENDAEDGGAAGVDSANDRQ